MGRSRRLGDAKRAPEAFAGSTKLGDALCAILTALVFTFEAQKRVQAVEDSPQAGVAHIS